MAFLENIFLHFLFRFSIQSQQIHNHTKYNKFALPGPGGIGIFLVTSVVTSIDISEFYVIWNYWFLISQTAATRKYCENNDETDWDVNCEILLFFNRKKNKLSYFFYVNVCRWHFSRIYFCISFSGFPFNRDKFTNSQSHEMYIFWLAGFRLVFNLGNIFFSLVVLGFF